VLHVSYGWRGKIGLIYMAPSEVMEPEFYAMSPEGVVTLTTRIHFTTMTAQTIRDMLTSDELEHCTQLLALADCGVILFGGTSCSFLGGPEWEKGLLKRMEEMSGGIPVINTAQSSVHALRAVGAKNIVFATPYTSDINQAGVNYFTQQGFNVVREKGLGITEERELAAVSLGDVYRLVRETDSPDADTVFISCTAMRTIPIIDVLETDLKKPVISAIQASMWYALQVLGIHDFVPGTGSLFTK
jgi:maleate isomerase